MRPSIIQAQPNVAPLPVPSAQFLYSPWYPYQGCSAVRVSLLLVEVWQATPHVICVCIWVQQTDVMQRPHHPFRLASQLHKQQQTATCIAQWLVCPGQIMAGAQANNASLDRASFGYTCQKVRLSPGLSLMTGGAEHASARSHATGPLQYVDRKVLCQPCRLVHVAYHIRCSHGVKAAIC